MHESGAQTQPRFAPDVIEWGFAPGEVVLVAHLPGIGEWQVADLLRADIADPLSRTIARAMLNRALDLMDETEPTSAIGIRP